MKIILNKIKQQIEYLTKKKTEKETLNINGFIIYDKNAITSQNVYHLAHFNFKEVYW